MMEQDVKAQHTPGPWSFDHDWHRFPTIFGSDKAYQYLEGQRDDYMPMTAVFAALCRKAIEVQEVTTQLTKAKADAVEQERARLRDLLENAEGIFANCSVEAGVCCCGDDMKNHSSPMLCGHSPVDLGAYQVDQWLNSYAALKRGDHKERADG